MRTYTRKSIDERFWPKVNKNGPRPKHVPELGPCWVWVAGKDKFGYGRFQIFIDNVWKCKQAHIVAWFIYNGVMPFKCVLHRCDNPSCVRLEHLFLGTKKENNIDRDQKGRNKLVQPNFRQRARGSKNGNSKLDEQKIIEIRKSYSNSDFTQQELANKYGVNQTKISDIVRRKTWAHVSDESVVG